MGKKTVRSSPVLHVALNHPLTPPEDFERDLSRWMGDQETCSSLQEDARAGSLQDLLLPLLWGQLFEGSACGEGDKAVFIGQKLNQHVGWRLLPTV